MEADGEELRCGASLLLSAIARRALENSLTGLNLPPNTGQPGRRSVL